MTLPAARTLDEAFAGSDLDFSERASLRRALAHDASHYLLVPNAILTPTTADEVAQAMAIARGAGAPLTFRSGGTSLSGQASTEGVLVDTRRHFRRIEVLDDGARVRVQPGATVRQVNARLARFGRKLGPDPASEIACTIGGVVANNSSGMACGTEHNTYNTLESVVVVLASGTIIDTAAANADEQLRAAEPELYEGLSELRRNLLADRESACRVLEQFRIKNTMGYSVNALLDFERPVDILLHLLVGSEGTLGFVAEAVFHTIPLLPAAATGLLIFDDLDAATAALPLLLGAGFATIELMDSRSLVVAQQQSDCPAEISRLTVVEHAALLVELQSPDARTLQSATDKVSLQLAELPLSQPATLLTDAAARAALWHVRKGLYTAVAGARPSGTTALLEDIAVPVERLLATCHELIRLFDVYGYQGCVIFGHAKDGNVHFMVNERFDEDGALGRYRRFTEDMVALVLENGGTLKADHGTGRIMAPFVRRQYGDSIYVTMVRIKHLFDPLGLLNPGVLINDDPDSYLRHLKITPTVEQEVDRCVECGYCEPACPSRNLTLTPRQRIVLRREMEAARNSGDAELLEELERDYEYEGVETCAVDGMCAVACPVGINTGDLVRRLRAEGQARIPSAIAHAAAGAWSPISRGGARALSIADRLPAQIVTGATRMGRALLGADVVPLYDADLPRGGAPRARLASSPSHPQAVYFPACVGTMFGPESESNGIQHSFAALAARAGVELLVPDGIDAACCGTPWKSKGFLDGYSRMRGVTLPLLLSASDNGRLPIVCDASSCTEGLETMREIAVAKGGAYAGLRFVDSVAFAEQVLLAGLTISSPLGSAIVHPTCSSTALGTTAAMTRIAQAVADEVIVPDDWNCCGFAGDRGMLHPELTASATRAEALEVTSRSYDVHVSSNRTCEVGMTRATGAAYVHILEVLERATRP
ncbi:FAD-binding and (Fe-S)-binding domain-containing protein [Diaminobutyricibacter tongyongensis]|nr:FAD-binding and (Fe-S)-binding domain-containing protein [Diaminobutyricibacter tongyongensis]